MMPIPDLIALAEDFVRVNGYTADAADPSRLSYDIMDFGTVEEILARRRKTLKPEAYSFAYGSAAVHVYFRHWNDDASAPYVVRVVAMRPDGTDARLVHQSMMFLLTPSERPAECQVPPYFTEHGHMYLRSDWAGDY